MGPHCEKRREERFDLEAPVIFDNGCGLSRDMSLSGIYFVTDQPFTPGRTVKFSVTLEYIRPGKPLQLDCQGQVLRIEPVGKQFGVAASISNYLSFN